MTIRQLLKAILRNIPFFHKLLGRRTGGTNSAIYCYSVWMKHLSMLAENNMDTDLNVVAELGPGDSIGTGLAALLSGVEEYFALDVVDFTNNSRDIEIYEELIKLFRKKAEPENGVKFPSHVLTEPRLEKALDNKRLERIRKSLLSRDNDGMIKKFIPWKHIDITQKSSVDFIFSHAVMEHVEDIADTYRHMFLWLKPGRVISHQIDYWSHDTAEKWNGHWTYSEKMWEIIKGNYSSLFINRHPHSDHINEMNKNGFEILSEKKSIDDSGLSKKELASKFKNITDEDIVTSSALVQAIKVG